MTGRTPIAALAEQLRQALKALGAASAALNDASRRFDHVVAGDFDAKLAGKWSDRADEGRAAAAKASLSPAPPTADQIATWERQRATGAAIEAAFDNFETIRVANANGKWIELVNETEPRAALGGET